MSTIQQNQHPDIIFKGIDGEECEAFVAALEDLAYAEGWTEDRRRMLFFARSRLRNAALRWFARLDPSVKNDWDLFVQALFDQYPPVSNPPTSNEVGVATPIWSATTFSPTLSNATLSANPRLLSAEEDVQNGAGSGHPPNEMILGSSHIVAVPSLRSYDSSRLGVYVGRLRIVYEAEIPPAYVWRGKIDQNIFYKANDGFNKYYGWASAFKCVTCDRQDALIVSFRIDSAPHPIACLDASQDTGDLAILLDSGSAEFHLLGATNGVKPASVVSWNGYLPNLSHQWVSKIWNVLGDGTLQANLSDFPEPALDYQGYRRGEVSPSNWTTTTVYMDTTGMPISFSKDYVTPNSLHPDSNRPLLKARIVFEPL